MIRFKNKTRRSWLSVVVPALVMSVAVLVLGLQAISAPSVSDLPNVPQGTARVTTDIKDLSTGATQSDVVTMDQWQPTVSGTGFKL